MNLMEAKKKKTSGAEAAQTANKAAEFVGEVKQEIGRISWTEPEELKAYTKIVVASVFLLGMGIYFVDVAIQYTLSGLSALVQMIAG